MEPKILRKLGRGRLTHFLRNRDIEREEAVLESLDIRDDEAEVREAVDAGFDVSVVLGECIRGESWRSAQSGKA
jgi:hypothetical protein